ncbi:MAG: chromosome segregation protein SMC, partial [Firmicutes bacterium]|nr:chromosome segregation protein SMC [Bacillota bacterium]
DEITADIDAREEQLEQLEIQRKNILDDDASAEAVEKMEEEKNTLQETVNLAVQERNSLNVKLDDIMQQQKVFDSEVVSLNDRMYSADIKKAKLETQLDSFKEKIWETFEITYLQALEYRTADFVLSRAVKENREIRQRMAQIGDVNIGAIEEYRKVSERYDFLTEQRADISGSMDDLRGIIDDMDKTIRERFRENFNNVADNFEAVFRELFGGGSAQLVLENPDNPLESNIDIVAQPPGKKLQNINLLSGGEKTMTAIAMMFAVLKTKPTPFCILDEVEAALDDANIERFSAYLRNFNEIQFALVTHQKATMEHADVLYGVTMPEQGVSKVLSLRLGDEFKLD